MEDKQARARSPQFPFIPLGKAVERARQFEQEFRGHAARPANVVTTWGYKEKTSGGIQTLAALVAFGLLDDEGQSEARRLKLSALGAAILKDARPGAREEALKKAALKPKVIAELWPSWGADRPPDHECISMLHLDRHFTEEAAPRFLEVYDATIRYAGLADSDKIDHTAEDVPEVDEEPDDDKPDDSVRRQPAAAGKVKLMDNERVVFAHEIRPNQSFRIVVEGEVDAEMVEAMKAFAEFQAKLVSRRAAPAKESADGTSG